MIEELKFKIGFRVREARKQRGMTQAELAEAVDKTFETISNIERGKTAPSLYTLCYLSEVLGVRVPEFLDDDYDQPDSTLNRRRLKLQERSKELVFTMSDKQLELWTDIGALLVEER